MKKLRLKALYLKGQELLTREQLKKVMGGSGDNGRDGDSIRCDSSNCSGHDPVYGSYSGTCAKKAGTGPVLASCQCLDSNGRYYPDPLCKAL